MRLKLYCNRFGHFKDALVCSVNCVYRTRCRDFALFYDEHRAETDALVADYYAARRAPQEQTAEKTAAEKTRTRASLPVVTPRAPKLVEAVDLRELIRLEVKREMAEASYIWIDKDGRAELLGQDEVLRRATRGQKPQTIYRVAQEMELRFQLVPRKRIEKARAAEAVEAERAAARRAARRAPAKAQPPAPEETVSAPPPAPVRRARRRAPAKAVTERS
jgi:septal ring-binding cell division protein DamX